MANTTEQATRGAAFLAGSGASIGAPCPNNKKTYCSIPECMLLGRCTQPSCEHRPVYDMTVFEQTLTSEGIGLIVGKTMFIAEISKNLTDYNFAYDLSTELKRARVQANKKIKELKADLKSQYYAARWKIDKDLEYVLAVVNPIIKKAMASRDMLDKWAAAIKENKARDQYIIQEKERLRLKEVKRQVKRDAETDKQDRFEFECFKSRLDFDEAWDWAEINFAPVEVVEISQEPWTELVSDDDFCQCSKPTVMHSATKCDLCGRRLTEDDLGFQKLQSADDALDELHEQPNFVEKAEKAAVNISNMPVIDSEPDIFQETEGDTAEPEAQVMEDEATETVTVSGREIEITETDTAEEIEEKLIKHPTADIIYSPDPTEKENQLLTVDTQKLKNISALVSMTTETLDGHQSAGFESMTATTATRSLIADIRAALVLFECAVKPVQEPGKDVLEDFRKIEIPEDQIPF